MHYNVAMTDFRHGTAAYLKQVMFLTGLSPTALAKKAGIASSTLTRFLNSPDHKFTLSSTTLEKIAKATGINPAPFLDADSITDLAAIHFTSHGVLSPEKWGDVKYKDSSQIHVVGTVAAGVWKEPENFDDQDSWPLALRSMYSDPSTCYALTVRGQSLNRIAQDGSFLICLSVDRTEYSLRDGDLVIVERVNDDRSLIEVTAKRLRGKEGSWQLWPESDDPKFQEPIELGSLSEDGSIRVVAVVEYIVREP